MSVPGLEMNGGFSQHVNGINVAADAADDEQTQVNGAFEIGSSAQTTLAGSAPPSQLVNGIKSTQTTNVGMSEVAASYLSPDITAMLARIPDDVYVPMGKLINRAAQRCWDDTVKMLELLPRWQIQDKTLIHNHLPNGQVDDRSQDNRLKKKQMWDVAETHKRILIKLLVILSWSSKSEDNRLTIAINSYLHELRQSFIGANYALSELVLKIPQLHDPAPDLDTAAEVLAAGKLTRASRLGYVEQSPLSDKQMLGVLKRLNRLLTVRMTLHEKLPKVLQNWKVHDGRLTFYISHEFELDVSVLSENTSLPFRMVDFRFCFSPSPVLSQSLCDQIMIIANQELEGKGLIGAYDFLHELTLTQKIGELQRQAANLAASLWRGQLRIELHKRTLVVQYWTQRQTAKSWLEIYVHSGSAHDEASHLSLRWMKHGQEVIGHDIELDLKRLNFETILTQVIARHTNTIFDSLYSRLFATRLYSGSSLELSQTSDSEDVSNCSLSVGITQSQNLNVTCDPTNGTLVFCPVSERVANFQHDMSRSKNLVEDFIKRLPLLRTALARINLIESIRGTTWQQLPGVDLSNAEIKGLFGPSAIRVECVSQLHWAETWLLAAVFGADGDSWYIVHQQGKTKSSMKAQILDVKNIHSIQDLSANYFQNLVVTAEEKITAVDKQRSKTGSLRGGDASETKPASHSILHLEKAAELDNIEECIVLQHVDQQKYRGGHYTRLAIVRLKANEATLDIVKDSNKDKTVEILPKRSIMVIKLAQKLGAPFIEDILVRLRRIDYVIACVKCFQNSSVFKVEDISVDKVTIEYHSDEGIHYIVTIPSDNTRPISFSPRPGNPHLMVMDKINEIVLRDRRPRSRLVRLIVGSLLSTLPLLQCLQTMQQELQSQMLNDEHSTATKDKPVKMHILVRSPQHYAIQYFTGIVNIRGDIDAPESQRGLLARLEIEHTKIGANSAWKIRPAIEEFETYTRSAFLSKDLEAKVLGTFNHEDKDWITNDGEAVCTLSKPQPLLQAVQKSIIDWAMLRTSAPNKNQQQTASNPGIAANRQTNGAPPTRIIPPVQTNPGQPNSVNRPQPLTNSPVPPSPATALAQSQAAHLQARISAQKRAAGQNAAQNQQNQANAVRSAGQGQAPANRLPNGVQQPQHSQQSQPPQQQQTTRVMNAPPQTIRQPPTNASMQRRPGQPGPGQIPQVQNQRPQVNGQRVQGPKMGTPGQNTNVNQNQNQNQKQGNGQAAKNVILVPD